MLSSTTRSVDTVERAAHLISTRGVEIVRCPPGHPVVRRDEPDHPVLYLLDPDGEAPDRWEELEDWVRLPVTIADLEARAARLLNRASALGAWWIRVDDDDVLRAGALLEPLSEKSAELARLLLDQAGSVVSRSELEAHLWAEGQADGSRALDNVVRHLRHRIEGLPIRINTSHGRGFMLERLAYLPSAAAHAS